MTVPDFLDTNVLVYAYDVREVQKRQIAQELVLKAIAGEISTSTQVLAEFTATVLHKLSPPLALNKITAILDALAPVPLVVPDKEIVQRALEAHSTYGIHFYDGMIIAAAERSGANRIWSEDLNPNQKYFGIQIENPFQY